MWLHGTSIEVLFLYVVDLLMYIVSFLHFSSHSKAQDLFTFDIFVHFYTEIIRHIQVGFIGRITK